MMDALRDEVEALKARVSRLELHPGKPRPGLAEVVERETATLEAVLQEFWDEAYDEDDDMYEPERRLRSRVRGIVTRLRSTLKECRP